MLESTLEVTARPASLELAGDLTFETAVEIRRVLAELVDADSDVLVLDISRVASFDLPGVQLIFSALHSARAADKSLSVAMGPLEPRMEKMFAFAGLPRDEIFQGG